MYLYTKDGERKKFIPIDNLGSGIQGRVYKISNDMCLKVFKGNKNDIKTPMTIRKLDLDGINKIYDFYYNKDGIYKGYTKEYQEKEELDILTMPTSYTLDNLYVLFDTISQLSERGIFASDLNTDNVIMNKTGITITDIDNFCKSVCFDESRLYKKNMNALIYLFKELYKESLETYHEAVEYLRYCYPILNLFDQDKENPVKNISEKLSEYKYPIDYLKAKSR